MRRRNFLAAALGATTWRCPLRPQQRNDHRRHRQQPLVRSRHRHAHGLGHGRRGREAPGLGQEVRGREPRGQGQRHGDPLGRRPRQVQDRDHRRKTPDMAMVGTTWMGEFAARRRSTPQPASIDSRPFFPGRRRPPWSTAPPTGSPGTSRPGSSTTARTWPEGRLLHASHGLGRGLSDGQGHADRRPVRSGASACRPAARLVAVVSRSRGPTAPRSPSDGKGYNFDTPVLEAVKYYQSFFTDGISDKAAQATRRTRADFVSGEVPMFISGPWSVRAWRRSAARASRTSTP